MKARELIKGARPRVNVRDVHQYLWSLADERNRLQISLATIAEAFTSDRETVNRILLAMRATGRIRYVGCRRDKAYIYEISNPETFRPGVAGTGLLRPDKPAWG